MAEARRQYPRDSQWEERADMQNRLRDPYRAEVAERYGFTMDELRGILSEGIRERWPLD